MATATTATPAVPSSPASPSAAEADSSITHYAINQDTTSSSVLSPIARINKMDKTSSPGSRTNDNQTQKGLNQSLTEDLTTTATGLSQTELEDLYRSFSLFDINGEGRIKVGTLLTALKEVQGGCSDQSSHSIRQQRRLHPIFKRLEAWKRKEVGPSSEENNQAQSNKRNDDNEEYLNFDEYVHLLTDPDPSDSRSELQKVFDLFDGEGNGCITVDDLSRVAQELGEIMTQEELEEMINRAGAGENGKVTYEQFENIMSKRIFDD